jgi:hypothetical protein
MPYGSLQLRWSYKDIISYMVITRILYRKAECCGITDSNGKSTLWKETNGGSVQKPINVLLI